MSNKYFFRAKISEEKFRVVLRFFSLDIEAKKTAELTGLNRSTINNIYHKIRERIAALCEAESPFENGEVELDESYFGARRVRGDCTCPIRHIGSSHCPSVRQALGVNYNYVA